MKILQLLRDNAGREKLPLNIAQNAAGEATIYIYDAIFADWGVSALAVIEALASLKGTETLNVRINSPGGDVFEGRAIMAAIRDYKGKTIAHIDSLCASAATSVALACDEIVMSDGAFFMIHNVHGLAFGDKAALRDRADTMEKVEGAIVNDYTSKTGKDEAQVKTWMEAETWFNAAEALENGFVDSIAAAPTAKPKNNWNLAAFGNAPAALKAPEPEEDPAPTPKPNPSMTAANGNRLRLTLL